MNFSNEAILELLVAGQDLDADTMKELLSRMLAKTMPPTQVAAVLSLLRAKKVTATEIAASCEFMVAQAVPIARPLYDFADIVGTGGDGHNTINVSTLASFTVASLGVPVAKHGSSSVSSKCGSADLLQELGVDIALSPTAARRSLDDNNWCFLFAPLYHTAFKSVKELRQELKIRTIFNIIGPLANPLAPPIMLMGVYDKELLVPFAHAIKNLKCKRALIVFGSGLDEIALHGPTDAMLLDHGSISSMTITPPDLGLSYFDLADIKGGEPEENARLSRALLKGQADEAKTGMVAASAGAVLWLKEKAPSLKDGVAMALDALHQGKPFTTLQKIQRTNYGA